MQPATTPEPASPGDTKSEELPFGWERVEDADFGIFYIDHINKTTQYDKPQPASDATRGRQRMEEQRGILVNGNDAALEGLQPVFCMDPAELKGRVLTTTLVKSPRGLGFTIVGHGGPDASPGQRAEPSLLQIRSITAGGPAAVDGLLRPADVLVYVDAICVLGHSHGDVVKVFQSIAVGATVTLTVNRGYRLPDLDSDTQVITTSAVGPEMSGDFLPSDGLAVEFVRVHLLKASTGFGFTIADSPQGQRIKQIVDQARCRLLQEGDILVEVDDKRVKEMPHLDVVQLLKDCSVGVVTRLLLQRHRLATLPRLRPMSTGGVEPSRSPVDKTPTAYNGSNGQANGRPGMKPDHKSVTIMAPQQSPPPTLNNNSATVLRPSQCPVPLPRSISEPVKAPTVRLLPATAVSECVGRPKPGVVARGPSLTIKPSKSFDNSNGVSRPSPSGSLAAVQRRLLSGSSYQLFSALRRRALTPDRSRPTSLLLDDPKAPAAMAEEDGDDTTTEDEREGEEPVRMKLPLSRGNSGFGFRLVGGAEEGTPITVGSIVPGGAAFMDGRLHCGDEIVEVDGISVIGASHHRAVQLMDGRSRILLTIRRPAPIARRRRASLPPPSRTPDVLRDRSVGRPEPVEVRLILPEPDRDGIGFGFRLSSSVSPRDPGTVMEVVDHVEPRGPADASGRVHVGDLLLSVNGAEVAGLRHSEVCALLQSCGREAVLRLLPHTPAVRFSFNNNNNNNDGDGDEKPGPGRGHQSRFGAAGGLEVFLRRGPRGFGFSIRGGYEFNRMPLFVLRIAEGGVAEQDGRMRVGDRILTINGKSTDGMTNADAVVLIQSQRSSIRLRLQRDSSESTA